MKNLENLNVEELIELMHVDFMITRIDISIDIVNYSYKVSTPHIRNGQTSASSLCQALVLLYRMIALENITLPTVISLAQKAIDILAYDPYTFAIADFQDCFSRDYGFVPTDTEIECFLNKFFKFVTLYEGKHWFMLPDNYMKYSKVVNDGF